MRCPKCGYISFDQVETCAKCSVAFGESGVTFVGTVLKVEVPLFLSSVLEGEASGEAAEFDLAGALVDSTGEDISEAADVEVDERLEEVDGEVPMVDLTQFDGESGDESAEEESEISLALPEDEEESEISMALPEDEEEPEISLALPEDEEESEIPAVESIEAEEGGIEFQLEDDEGPGLDLSLEEPVGLEEEEPESTEQEEEVEFESEEMPTIALESGDEELPAQKSAAGASGSDLSLDIDADIEDDEPADEEMVFNLEDIDMSDLVIEESKDAPEGSPEDSTLGLEDYLNTGGRNEEESPPMDLSLEDGQLVEEEAEKKDGDLPEIEL